jgi:polysaccharide export outer membrane protein
MKKYSLRHVWLFVIVSVSYGIIQGGCQSSVGQRVRPEPSPTEASVQKAIQGNKQNLSMANRLKNSPPTEYILGPEDTVEISVFRHDELKMEVAISATGKIPYYLIGDVQAGGLTQFQLRDTIQRELAKFIKDPKVVVRITEYRSHKAFVLGQVKNPGVYRMRNDYTLLEAISSAGGITPDAYLSGAFLVRDGKMLLVNFLDLIKRGNTEENIPLLPGDIVYIPDKSEQKVYILGEVNKQSGIPIQERLTLLEAIAQAGGFTHDANKKSILLLRGNLSEPEIMTIDAKHILKESDLMANIPLQRGDIVYVPSSLFADVERVAIRLSNILEPLLKIERGIILQDIARDVIRGENIRTTTRIVIGD